MANLSSDNLAAKQDEFASEQLKPVDALFAANNEQVDFAAAKTIGLISDDVRTKIEAEMGNDKHKFLFKRALDAKLRDVGRMDESGRREAFRAAFEAVYGRFLFEDDKSLGKADSEYLDEKLGAVLKFPVDAKYGFKGRSELQAAVRRLAMVTRQGNLTSIRADLDEQTNSRKAEAEGLAKDIQSLDALVFKFDELPSLQSKITTLDSPGNVGERFAMIDNLSKTLDVFNETVQADNFVRDLSKSDVSNLSEAYKIYGKCRKTLRWIQKDGNAPTALLAELAVSMSQLSKIARDLLLSKREILGSQLNQAEQQLGVVSSNKLRSAPEDSGSSNKFARQLAINKDKINLASLEARLKKAEAKELAKQKEDEVSTRVKQTSLAAKEAKTQGLLDVKSGVTEINTRFGELLDLVRTAEPSPEKGAYNLNEKMARPFDELSQDAQQGVKNFLDLLQKNVGNLRRISNELSINFPKDLFAALGSINSELTLRNFVNNSYKPFASVFIVEVDRVLAENASENAESGGQAVDILRNINLEKIRNLTSQISALKSSISAGESELQAQAVNGENQNGPEVDSAQNSESSPLNIQELIDRAFGGGKPPEELKEMERLLAESQSHRTELDEVYKYVTGKEPVAIRSKYEAIAKSKATAEDIRTAEAALKKAEDNKVKLDGVKALFSEDKTSALNDIFNEASALENFYAQAQKSTNLEATITSTSSGVDFREKQITAALEASKKKKGMIGGVLDKIGGIKEPDIGVLRDQLAEQKLELEKLKKVKAESDKFKEQAKKVRNELLKYCREYLVAFELLKKKPISLKVDKVKALKETLEGMNIDKGFNFADLSAAYTYLKTGFGETSKLVVDRLDEADITIGKKQDVETRKKELEKAKALHADLKVFVEKIKHARSLGLEFSDQKIEEDFAKIDVDHMDFTASEVAKFYEEHIEVFVKDGASITAFAKKFENRMVALDKAVKTSKSALDKAKSGNAMLENLTDAQAAKKIIVTLVAQQFPDMSLEDQYKMATAILADDVATIQTTESYEKFAERAGADVLDTMKQAGFKGKLIGFKYKIGDKEEQPFKGLKPEDFADWPIMERHFNTGKFNHENGFFILAAMELFNGDVKSIQAVKTEKMLKTLIAKQLGVDERMDEAGISRIVDKAFDKQMEKVRPLVKSYFDHYDSNREEWESHSLRAMKLKLKALNQDRRTGKITEEVYAMKYEVLLKEAEASGVLDKLGLAQNTVLASFANSPFSQWFRDRGYDFKERAKKKAAGFAWSTTKVAASGVWGATKFTAKLATKPITIPLKLAAKLGVGFVNLFRANKWQPEILQKKTAAETKSLLEKTKEVASGVVGTYAEDWKARTHDKTKFSDRIEMGSDVLTSQADELAEKGKSTAVETTSPFIDLEEFKKQIAMIDAMKNAPASNDNKESKAA